MEENVVCHHDGSYKSACRWKCSGDSDRSDVEGSDMADDCGYFDLCGAAGE